MNEYSDCSSKPVIEQNDSPAVVHSPETVPFQRAWTLYPVICSPLALPKPSFVGGMKSTAASLGEMRLTLINVGTPARPPTRRETDGAEGRLIPAAFVAITVNVNSLGVGSNPPMKHEVLSAPKDVHVIPVLSGEALTV